MSAIEIENSLDRSSGSESTPGEGSSGSHRWHVSRRWTDNGLRLASIAIFLILWQIAGSRMSPILLSTPTSVAQALGDLAGQGILSGAIVDSLKDLCVGFGLAIITGIGLGVLMGRFRVVETVLDPYVSFMNATPTVALLPLVIIWFGIGFGARVIFVFLLALWSILVNTSVGIKTVNRGYMELADSFGLSQLQVIRRVSLPAAVPYILAGVRVGLGKAIVGMIIGEMDMQLAGLGGLVSTYGDSFQTSRLLAVILCSSAFGVFFVAGLKLLQKVAFPWIADTAGSRQ
ncbi:MAG: ABC transporter permease [Chloroflexota bacterium]